MGGEMNTTTNTQPRINQKPLCFSCGSKRGLRPYESMWGTWHVCRKCEIEGEKAKAKRGKGGKAK